MNCNFCNSILRVVPEQVGVEQNGIPVFRTFAYCDNCRTRFVVPGQQAMCFYNQNQKSTTNYSISGWIISMIGFVGCMLSIFMPFVSFNALGFKKTENLFNNTSDGWFVLMISVVGLILCACRYKTYTVDAIIVGIANGYVGFFQYSNISKNLKENADTYVFAEVGFGTYFLIISSILTMIGGIIMFVYKRNNSKK